MVQLTLGAEALQNYETSSRREWLVTNGIGGYASSSVSGANTRRYHGLLVAAVPPHMERFVALSKVEATALIGTDRIELNTNDYPGTLYPLGYLLLERFDAFPVPTFFCRLRPGVLLRKRVWMERGRNTTYMEYTLLEGACSVHLTVRPLVCWKSYHAEMHACDGFPAGTFAAEDEVAVSFASGTAPLRLHMDGAGWQPASYWHYNVQQQRDRERGMEWVEDLYCPGSFEVDLTPGASCVLIASVEGSWSSPGATLDALSKRQDDLVTVAKARNDLERALVLAADAFVVEGGFGGTPRTTVIAGYPWFTDWGRDTMISLPGLCLATGRLREARDILTSFARYVDHGMLPNRFPDYGQEPEYNTVDATLFYIEAIRRYVEVAPDGDAVARELLPILIDIVEWHHRGTRFGIRVDPNDGLLRSGQPGVQLTWMDARVGSWVVTPRSGKAVEINALWVSALRTVAALCEKTGVSGVQYAAEADRAAGAFERAFARPDGQGLYDVIGDDGAPDPAIRPNQVIAAALPLGPVSQVLARSVVAIAKRDLLTPVGLRTLAPGDPAYRGRFEGGPVERDGAYHQGTVWPWLLGAYVEALLRSGGSKREARELVRSISDELLGACIGQLSEVYDGDVPQRPAGCFAQAWSIGEVLRVCRLLDGGPR